MKQVSWNKSDNMFVIDLLSVQTDVSKIGSIYIVWAFFGGKRRKKNFFGYVWI